MTKYGQPVISRETRLLLITMLVSIAALWVLARIRFQERSVASVPVAVPPVLAQLRPETGYADLARAIADIRPAAAAAVITSTAGAPALRVREDAAVTLHPHADDVRLAVDRATGLSIVRTPVGDVPRLVPWVPRLLDYPRYLAASDVAAEHVMLRPVFVSGLIPVTSPLWNGQLWLLPPAASMTPGTFVFTTDGAFAGLVVEHGGRSAIVPATLLLDTATALLQSGNREAGSIGVTVQPLSASIAAASGARSGMVVTAVEPGGPAAAQLIPTDIIEAIDGQPIETAEHWRARIARLNVGDSVSLHVRSGHETRELQIVAASAPVAPPVSGGTSLGLRLRAVPTAGVQVTAVESGSSAARAGIQVGDLITVAGRQAAPTPAQLTRAFATTPPNESLLIALSRSGEHHVVALRK